MPDIKTIETGFGFIKNKDYDGYLLENISGVHQVVTKYKKYKYYITLTYKPIHPIISEEKFYNNHIFDDKTLLSSYGNPYICKLWKVKKEKLENGDIKIYLEGESTRIK